MTELERIKIKSRIPRTTSQEEEYNALLNTVKNYEDRIKEIEGSIYWKIYLFFTKTKLILTSDSYLKNDKWRFFQRIRFLFSKPGLFLISKFFKQLFSLLFGKVNRLIAFNKTNPNAVYDLYKERKFPRAIELKGMKDNLHNFSVLPFIEIYVLVNSENFKYLNGFLNQLEKQIYPHYHITFYLQSESDKILYTLNKIVENDDKFKIVRRNTFEHEKKYFDADFVLVADLSCELAAHCLYQMVYELNSRKKADFIYADNDFYDEAGSGQTRNPYFKPDWSPHTILSRNYIGKVFLTSARLWIETPVALMDNNYALVLDLTHRAQSIYHIPSILYHENPEHLHFKKILSNHDSLNSFLIKYYGNAYAKLSEESLGSFEPLFKLKANALISIIIPSRNKASILDTCLKSLFEKSAYRNFEVIVIDNGSTEKSFFSTVAEWEYNYPGRVRCIREDIPFNYSILNNKAARYAKGDYLLFLNNDTKLISEHLLENLLQIAQLDNVGFAGPKLLYPNNTLQHVGIVLSVDDAGAHVYSGAHKDTAGYFNNTNCLTNYSAVTGACMMIAKEKFNAVGGFDENLAVDCNDVELCCRLMKHGFYNVYVPWVKMYHHECLTRGNPIISNKSMVKQNQEKEYFMGKWNDLINNDPFYNINLSRTSKYFDINND